MYVFEINLWIVACFHIFYTPFLRKKKEHVKRTYEAGAFSPLQNDVFVVCVVFQHEHGRDREHHAEEGCRAGAAGRGADHRRATEVRARALTASPVQGIIGVGICMRKSGCCTHGGVRARCSRKTSQSSLQQDPAELRCSHNPAGHSVAPVTFEPGPVNSLPRYYDPALPIHSKGTLAPQRPAFRTL